MPDIIDNGDGTFSVETIVSDYQSKADIAIGQIDDRLTLLNNSPTNAQILGALIDTIELQRKEIKLLKKILLAIDTLH